MRQISAWWKIFWVGAIPIGMVFFLLAFYTSYAFYGLIVLGAMFIIVYLKS